LVLSLFALIVNAETCSISTFHAVSVLEFGDVSLTDLDIIVEDSATETSIGNIAAFELDLGDHTGECERSKKGARKKECGPHYEILQ
jgi:hypothetical protein